MELRIKDVSFILSKEVKALSETNSFGLLVTLLLCQTRHLCVSEFLFYFAAPISRDAYMNIDDQSSEQCSMEDTASVISKLYFIFLSVYFG